LSRSAAHLDIAEMEVQDEEAFINRQANERSFSTSTGTVHAKLDETQIERPAYLRKSFKLELLHGPQAERSRALRNAGMEVQTNVHYSNHDCPTHARMSLADSRMRNDMKVSATNGVTSFGKNAQFSTPIDQFIKGAEKDEEMDVMYTGLSGTNPHRILAGTAPRASAFASVPSLASVKGAIHNRIERVWGQRGYVTLRHKLYDNSDHEGFTSKAHVISVLRDDLGLTLDEVPEKMLDHYVQQLFTMKKQELRISSFMSSLRPSLPLKVKCRVLEAFRDLRPTDGCIALGNLLRALRDSEIRRILTSAFGGTDEPHVSGMPISQDMFVDLFSDLAPLTDVEQLLQEL